MTRHRDGRPLAGDLDHALAVVAAMTDLDAGDAVAALDEADDLAALDDVDAEGRCAARVAPGDRIVPRRAGAALPQGTEDGIAGVPRNVQPWLQRAQLPQVQQVRI